MKPIKLCPNILRTCSELSEVPREKILRNKQRFRKTAKSQVSLQTPHATDKLYQYVPTLGGLNHDRYLARPPRATVTAR